MSRRARESFLLSLTTHLPFAETRSDMTVSLWRPLGNRPKIAPLSFESRLEGP